jgi:3-hydroxyacyl-[acyl-carrier-protein] dehydratase
VTTTTATPTLVLPMTQAAITRILPHRHPFLLVDRITIFEPDKRIVGIKNVTAGERYLSPPDERGRQALPPTILTEAIAQVGGILILAKPENEGRLVYFRGIERARFRDVARPGESVEIEVRVVRLRSKMGVLTGFARIGDRLLVKGTMTFALGPKADGSEGTGE